MFVMNHYFLFVSFLFCFFCAEENNIFIIEIPFNASIQTPSRRFLEKLIPESTDFHGELQEHFKKSSNLLKRNIYCLSAFNGLSHAHLLIQSQFPIFKKLPYIPILYHLIPYLLYGEDVFSNTVEYVNRYFSKDSQIFLLTSNHDYPEQEVIALAKHFYWHKFENVQIKQITKSNEEIPLLKDFSFIDEYTKASLNKQWWIDQFWFRCFLRFSRFSLGFIIFAVPFFILRKKNF